MDEQNIKVAVRIRPISVREAYNDTICIHPVDDKQLVVGTDRPFTFDHVFPSTATQGFVYDTIVADMVSSFFCGYNTTIFAYGQTGAGKTYTMGTSDESSSTSPGIIPRVVQAVFQRINREIAESSSDAQWPEVNFDTRLSYLEIYNESIRDLLHPSQPSRNITVRDDGDGNIIVMGVREETVGCKEELMDWVQCGNLQRTTGATLMNDTSSRSHSVFTLYMEQRRRRTDEKGAVHDDFVASKFHLVDLAGSERAKKTGAAGSRLKESMNINSGLLALGNVISALADSQRRLPASHVPYRDSKLTRLLQDSLGGNSKTLMIACISPSSSSLEESLNTLRYANRARNIRNKPVINRDPHAMELAQLKGELKACKLILMKHNLMDQLPLAYSELEGLKEPAGFDANHLLSQLEALQEEGKLLQVEKKNAFDADGEDTMAMNGKPPPINCHSTAQEWPSSPRKATQAARSSTPVRNRNSNGTPTGVHSARSRPCSQSRVVTSEIRQQKLAFKVNLPSGKITSDITEIEEELKTYEALRINWQKLNRHAESLKEELFNTEWKSVELTMDLQREVQEHAECQRQLSSLNEYFRKIINNLTERIPTERESIERIVLSIYPQGFNFSDDSLKSIAQTSTSDAAECFGQDNGLDADLLKLKTDYVKLQKDIAKIMKEKEMVEQRANDSERIWVAEQEHMQNSLRTLSVIIKGKEELIAELHQREVENGEMRKDFERRLELYENDKFQMHLELKQLLSQLEKSNIDALLKEQQKQQAIHEYDMRIKNMELKSLEQRKRLKEQEQLLKQHKQESDRLKKLQAEVAVLKEQQDALRNKMKLEHEKAGAVRLHSEQQIQHLKRQIAELEGGNKKASSEIKRKEEDLMRVRSQFDRERARYDQVREQLLGKIEKEEKVREENAQRNSLVDKQLDIMNRRRDFQEKLRFEVHRREIAIQERTEKVEKREQLESELGNVHHVLHKALNGWNTRMKTLFNEIQQQKKKLQKSQTDLKQSDKAAEIKDKLVDLEYEFTEVQAKHDKLDAAIKTNSAQSYASALNAQLKDVDDQIESLESTVKACDDQIEKYSSQLKELESLIVDPTPEPDTSISPRPNFSDSAIKTPMKNEEVTPRLNSPFNSSTISTGKLKKLDETEIDSEGCGKKGVVPQITQISPVDAKALLTKYYHLILENKQVLRDKEEQVSELVTEKQEDKRTIEKLENAIQLMEANHRRQLHKIQSDHNAEIHSILNSKTSG